MNIKTNRTIKQNTTHNTKTKQHKITKTKTPKNCCLINETHNKQTHNNKNKHIQQHKQIYLNKQ